MKKRLIVIAIIILFLLGIKKEVDGKTIKTYSVNVYSEYSDSEYFYSGYVFYDSYDVEEYNFITIDGIFNREGIMIVLSNTYLDPNDDRYFNPYHKIYGDSKEVIFNKSVSESINCSSYKYAYLMEYIDISIDDERITNNSLYVSFEVSDFKVGYVRSFFVISYDDEVTTYGALYDVSNISIFKVKSIYDYSIELYSDEYSQNYLIPGTYEVKYRVYDSFGNEEIVSLYINVLYEESLSPYFFDNGLPDIIDITSPPSLDEITGYIKAYDKNNNDITSKIVFKTDYDLNNLEIKTYTILASVVDDNGYGCVYKKEIVVSDLSKPCVGKTSLKISYNKKLSYDDIIAILDIEDYSPYSYEILTDAYTSHYNILGRYYISIKLKDIYNNEDIYSILINVIDDINPYVLTRDIKTTTAECLSNSEIESCIIISDKTRCMVSFKREEYDASYNKKGIYEIEAIIEDSSGNQTIRLIKINVISDSYIKFLSDKVYVTNNHSYTEEELILFFQSITSYTYDRESTSIIESNYFKTPYEAGTYNINMVTTDSEGYEYKESYKIVVLKDTAKKIKNNKLGDIFKDVLQRLYNIMKMIFYFLF